MSRPEMREIGGHIPQPAQHPFVLVGIHPTTRKCVLATLDDDSGWAEARAEDLIVVRVRAETARMIFDETVSDIYAIAEEKTDA